MIAGGLVGVFLSLSGCVLHTHPRRSRVVYVEKGGRSCPPAHHWDGRGCAHNGKAKGHYK